MDTYTLVILLTFFGFVALAAMLLVPVYLFLKKEERLSESWTKQSIAEQQRGRKPGGDGAASLDDEDTTPPHG